MAQLIYIAAAVVGAGIVGACSKPVPIDGASEAGPAKVAAAHSRIDISYNTYDHYQGNFTSPTWIVDITGPDQKTWKHIGMNDWSHTRIPPDRTEFAGTYEIEGDLAVFTGKKVAEFPAESSGDEFRFAVNFGFPPGGYSGQRTAFNSFFPDKDGGLTLHRKLFRRMGGQWQPSQELLVTIPGGGPQDEKWKIQVVGRFRQWDREGKMTEEVLDSVIDYKPWRPTLAASWAQWNTMERLPRWMPTDLVPFMHEGRMVMAACGGGGRFVLYVTPEQVN